jgi:serine/threonine protein kinase
MASVSTATSTYFIPQQLAATTSSNLIERTGLSGCDDGVSDIDTATFLGQLVQRQVPVFGPEKVPKLTKLRDLGRGGSFTAIAGTLADDFGTSKVQYEDNAPPYLVPTTYKAGQVVVARHLNFNSLEEEASDDRSRLLASLSTEILILSDERVKRHNQIVELIGVGWESSPYDESEVPRHWPFILTAFGSQGTLQDLLRDIHRRHAPEGTPQLYRPAEMLLQKPLEVNWEYHLEWTTKLALVAQIAKGLAFLHSVGVVHGDIKFENIVFGRKLADYIDEADDGRSVYGTAQLCDFGSSFLLANAETENSLCSLRSYSFPWEAPEVLSPMPAKDLPRTDVYSFGLLFARVILDGNDPFDTTYHVASGRLASYDQSKVNLLKVQDQVADLIIDQIKSSNLFEDKKLLQFIETIIQQTVRTDPKRRWHNMEWLSISLQQALSSDGASLLIAQ